MYEAFFGLREKPFSLVPDPSLLYLGEQHALAYSMLEYGLLHQAGFTVITGEIGCGKTTLLRQLLNQIPDKVTVGLINNTRPAADELLQWVMLSLGQPYKELSRVALFDAFTQFLVDEYSHGRRVVLIIDEAQNLDIDTLEQLRMLSNINADKDMVLQIILVGQPQLREKLSHPDLVQFSQRIAVDFHLGPLNEEETKRYIACRIEKAGGDPALFTPEAMQLVYQSSHGTPRIVNLLCDTALTYAFAEEKQRIDAPIVRDVLRDRANMIAGHAETHAGEAEMPSTTTREARLFEHLERAGSDGPGRGAVSDHASTTEEELELTLWLESPLDSAYPYVYLLRLECASAHPGDEETLLTAFAIDEQGYRKVLGIEPGLDGAQQGWNKLLRSLHRRGLKEVELFICEASDEQIGDIMDIYPSAVWQRDLHTFYEEILARVPEEQRAQIEILLKIVHAQGDADAAAKKADEVFRELTTLKLTEAATLLVSYAHESLTYYDYPREHRKDIRSAMAFRAALDEISANFQRVTPLPAQGSRMHLFASALRHLEEEKWRENPALLPSPTIGRASNA